MNARELYNKNALEISKITTVNYSTSFSLGIKTIDKTVRSKIYAIYGFARFADEIVDTFLELPVEHRNTLLMDFKKNTFQAIEFKVSPYPIVHAFQQVVHEYTIDHALINAFFDSMETDLYNEEHGLKSYNDYIYGSAEVIGLMCLKVFVDGDQNKFDELKNSARKLGAAFQKVNFLRDMKSDFEERGRVYFPDVNFNAFDKQAKQKIENEIEQDFKEAYKGIIQLPETVRKGVYLAYKYYLALFEKIRKSEASIIQVERTRIPDYIKLIILLKSMVRTTFRTY